MHRRYSWLINSSTTSSQCPRSDSGTSARLSYLLWRCITQQRVQAVVLPCRFASLLLSSLNAKSRMLVWDNVLFLVGIEWLVLRGDIDLFGWQLDARKVFEQVGVVCSVHVDMAEGGIARL